MKLKVLILGSTGLIGHQVYKYLDNNNKYQLFNIAFRKKLNDQTILCDVRDQEKFISVVEKISPDVIVNCIGILIEGANLNPETAIFVNAFFPHRLMRLADQLNCKIIHISTDCVFSGSKKTPYNEYDYKDGKDIYAKTKGLGEIINDTHLTLRTSVIGPELKSDGQELFHWFMNQNGEIRGFTKAIWSGVTTLILARVVNWAIESETTGLYQVTNNESIDKFTLLGLIKKHTGKNIIIHPSDHIILDKSFKDNRQELDFKIPSFDEMIKEMVTSIKNKRDYYSQYDLF